MIECHVYIVVLNVLYDDVYMYKSLQIKFLFCSVSIRIDLYVHSQILKFSFKLLIISLVHGMYTMHNYVLFQR